jgi:hypothetical protein
MPERFESSVFDPVQTALMKSALEAAMLKCKPSRADEKQTQTLLASAIIDLVTAGEWRLDQLVEKALVAYSLTQKISQLA